MSSQLAAQVTQMWRHRSIGAVLLLPLSALFGIITGLRRIFQRRGLAAVKQYSVPVIVVGNIAVGGSGKTPVVAWLVDALRTAKWSPGIVSRGYGAAADQKPGLVDSASDPARVGDEPLLLARLTGAPVSVDPDRPAAVRRLLAAHPEIDVIVSDDGMQHYRLARTVEIAVVDETVLGNRWLMPAGPLREPLSRLASVDLVIAHGPLSDATQAAMGDVPVVSMALAGERFRSLNTPEQWCEASAFKGRPIHAIAGIGRPERFFNQLQALGLDVVPHPFADHHAYSPADLAFSPGETRVMTAKDAVKCTSFAPPDSWEFPVEAQIDARALGPILEKLDHGPQTA